MVSVKSLNRAAVWDGVAVAAQAAIARTNMHLFIASPLEFARSRSAKGFRRMALLNKLGTKTREFRVCD